MKKHVLLLLVLCGCPERQVPERGLQLVYKKANAESVRSNVDRRLAHLKLRANLSEDDSRLTVRVAEGADVSRIKALFAKRGQLEFCQEDSTVAARWCDEKWPDSVRVDSTGKTCALIGGRKQLETALADAGVEFSWGHVGAEAAAYSISKCFKPRIVSAEPHPDQPAIAVEFDKASGREFATITTETVGKRLLIRLDGEVDSAPVVMEPITAGKAMITAGKMNRDAMEVLAAALVGGSLPELVLEQEGTWGPPSLKR